MWEVELWHNHNDDAQWQALKFQQEDLQIARTAATSTKFSWFVAKLVGRPQGSRTSTRFTVRFRTPGNDGWKWLRDVNGTTDGELIYQAKLDSNRQLSYFIEGMSPDIRATRVPSETPDTQVWSLEAPAAAANGDSSAFSRHTLGLPTNFDRWFALVRLWSPWLAPRQGRRGKLAEKDALIYAFSRKDGLHVVTLAVSGVDDVLTVMQDDDGRLALSVRSDREEPGVARAIVSVGSSFDDALAAAVYYARRIVAQVVHLPQEHQALLKHLQDEHAKKDVKANWVEDWVDGFAFCTWNALGQNLTQEKISNALESLEKNNISITNLIIDDNWQSLDNDGKGQFERGWTDFEANKAGFPQGMAKAIASIREKHPSINHIAVWHAMMGYWGGVSPSGNLAKQYKTRKVCKGSEVHGGTFTVIDGTDIKRMYDDFYRFLSSCGIDSVKTDVQFMLDELDEAPARRELIMPFLNAWNIAQLRHFGGHAISCMSQAPQIIFHSQLPTNMPALPARTSDDFFPDIEDSHPWHIFCNAHNALLAKHLNVLPDWDMFQSHHHWSGFHAAARCISGGPVYVTDEPGKHDVGLIEQVTARTSRGQTVILRPSVIGRSIEAYVGYEDKRLCMVGAYNGPAATGSSFMGVFNCRPSAITEILHLSSYLGTDTGNWIVRAHRTGHVGGVMSLARAAEAVEGITVDGYSWELLTARPVTTMSTSEGKRVRVADFGLVGKLTGAAAILHSSAELTSIGPKVQVKTTLKALGTWGFWLDLSSSSKIDLKESLIFLADQIVPFHCVKMDEHGLILVDIDRAWKELGLTARYNNEVNVEALIKLP